MYVVGSLEQAHDPVPTTNCSRNHQSNRWCVWNRGLVESSERSYDVLQALVHVHEAKRQQEPGVIDAKAVAKFGRRYVTGWRRGRGVRDDHDLRACRFRDVSE